MAAFGRGFQGCGTLPWLRTTTVRVVRRVTYQVSPLLASERFLCTTLVVLSTGVPYCTSNPPRRPPPPVALDSMADYTPFSGYARCESSALLLILVAICMSRVVLHKSSCVGPGTRPSLAPGRQLHGGLHSPPRSLETSHANPMRCSSSGASRGAPQWRRQRSNRTHETELQD